MKCVHGISIRKHCHKCSQGLGPDEINNTLAVPPEGITGGLRPVWVPENIPTESPEGFKPGKFDVIESGPTQICPSALFYPPPEIEAQPHDYGLCDECQGYKTITVWDRRPDTESCPTCNGTGKDLDLKRQVERFLCKVNAVTACHRHGLEIPKSKLDALSNAQLELEEVLKEQPK